MFSNKRGAQLAATTVLALIAFGCGAKAQRDNLGQSGTPGGGTPTNYNPTNPIADGYNPNLRYSFSVAGTTADNNVPPVNTDTKLSIRVVASGAGKVTTDGYQFVANYNCIKYKVTVRDTKTNYAWVQNTKILAVQGNPSYFCQGAPEYDTLEFSGDLVAGHGPLKVTVAAVGYDFYAQDCFQAAIMDPCYPGYYNPSCNAYGSYAYGGSVYGCNNYYPITGMRPMHTATGDLLMQVNGSMSN